MLYTNVQRFVSFKCPHPQITVVTYHPCYDTVTLNPNNQTELHGIAVALLCDELTRGLIYNIWEFHIFYRPLISRQIMPVSNRATRQLSAPVAQP